MLAVQGYYDGNYIKPLEKITVNKNQKVIITVLDEYINENSANTKNNDISEILNSFVGIIPDTKKVLNDYREERLQEKYEVVN